jgi:cystathionine gamma-synthase
MSLHANEPSCSRTTAAVRAGIDRDTAHGAVTPPIVLSSNFSFEGFGNKRQYDYTRSGNPTRDLLGEALAELEGGAGGVITATGMGAINLVLNALLQPGDTLVVPHDAYGGSWRLFNALAKKGHFELVTADLTDPRALAQALATQPKLVLVETPSNPLLRITDLRFVIDAAHKAGALVVVDNTFLSPACSSRCRSVRTWCCIPPPYINGHSDVVGGAVVARDPALHEQLVWWGNALGLTGSPFDAFLTLRGLRTLDARLRAPGEHRVDRCAAGPASGGRRGLLPGLADHRATPSPRASKVASARCCRSNWRTARVMIRMRRCVPSSMACAVSPGRIAGRRRKPDRASGHHDPCGDDRRSACRRRHQRRPAAPVGRHRGRA